ncbi:hypothetical protein SAMN05443667_101274 [Flavobacterium gillisiae]|uniref:Uncharacterized protein n=1 Tax=Flavobacterium gillisiae TaxID=150146 RepID=A0A1H3WWZ6_9FLAO|nr:hypothetical protein [Flavobacterium gillisiae]SDZ91490.1 hypothetical protein SAMN05443667_101274 [Flavobacterium gillisiae]
MSTTIANSVLNIISTFSPEELEAFSAAFNKLKKPVANSRPKNIKPITVLPTLDYCMNVIRAKYSIQVQGKLA